LNLPPFSPPRSSSGLIFGLSLIEEEPESPTWPPTLRHRPHCACRVVLEMVANKMMGRKKPKERMSAQEPELWGGEFEGPAQRNAGPNFQIGAVPATTPGLVH